MENLAIIVEDDFDASVIFEKALAINGYKTESIAKGDLAMARLKKIVPNLVLLDLHLPVVNGKEILEYIRKDDRFEETKVVLITADPRMAEILSGDADLVLLKPTTFTQVRDFIARLARRASISE